MIDIGRISRKDRYNYRFPTIDFKFQNTGASTAFLWQFEIKVISTEIDITPVLEFHLEAVHDGLFLRVANNGWGTMNDFEIKINSDILNQLFPNSSLMHKDSINSGEATNLFLTIDQADPDQFRAISNLFTVYRNPLFSHMIIGIELKDLKINWSGKDDRGIKYCGEEDFSSKFLFLTPKGFFQYDLHDKYSKRLSDTTYIAYGGTVCQDSF